MRKDEPYPPEHWVYVQARKILSALGYDITKEIYPQFLERHREGLQNIKKDRKKSSSSTKK